MLTRCGLGPASPLSRPASVPATRELGERGSEASSSKSAPVTSRERSLGASWPQTTGLSGVQPPWPAPEAWPGPQEVLRSRTSDGHS